MSHPSGWHRKSGVRPGLHEPDRLWPWVFGQHQVWVDIHGAEHEIESMQLDYVQNVIAFCQSRARDIRQIVELDQLYEVFDLLSHGEVEAAAVLHCALRDGAENDQDWLEQTPLLAALRRRLARPTRRCRGDRR